MCLQAGLAEDNARFILLAFVLTAYMFAGAVLFQTLESDLEVKQAAEFWKVYNSFRKHHLRGNSQALYRLHELLYAYGNATTTGVINKRRRWDFYGSFHFVGTIVTTIGYGSTTPQTPAGKIAVIFYGFFGCSGGILFFNLFLERIITFLAYVLRSLHLRRLKKRLSQTTSLATSRRCNTINNARSRENQSLPDILDDDEEVGLEHWKPSVYWVMLYLTLFSWAIACIAAAFYAPFEQWGYLEALYFCFVSFATIGFGDYVSMQKTNYPYSQFYIIANFFFLMIGCCCIYSLLNVTSIVIKQGLNYAISKVECPRNKAVPHLPRRRSSTTYHSRRRPTKLVPRDSIRQDENSDDVDTPRRMSGELISIKEFLSANKVSLAVMQKQLYETAQMQKGNLATSPTFSHQPRISGPLVGPLAIASQKFETNNCR